MKWGWVMVQEYKNLFIRRKERVIFHITLGGAQRYGLQLDGLAAGLFECTYSTMQ